ncbi:MAG: DNA polymerase III subunit gamma/tau, partial [Acetobacter malorum]
MTDKTDAHHSRDDGLPDPVMEGPGLFGDAAPAVPAPASPPQNTSPYRVLARKYRPTTFDDLIGQEAMVRTLRNAFALGRVAHAFMLTGVRGVGKTTTARIIARALNCIGPDGNGGPTADPCGVCANCVAILNDRHPDVLEMDAASRTGVDDVREIIEATRFRPMQGRMKVFIIDEVHMLSRNAFNALLKTLEEPPAQVTFIFATTELRKVPVTVLSRCQRFDLRRVPQADLAALFARIAEKEHVRLSEDALALIARAADGSVRDGLSLLDQAIAQGEDEAEIGASVVSDMLGLADRQVVFDLLDAAMTGKPDQALALADAAHARGADLGLVLGDMLDLIHTISRLRAVPSLRDSAEMPEAERVRGTEMAEAFPVPVLMRAWQMLVKGLKEVEMAPDRRAAADMVLIRLCYVADLPSPEDLVRRLSGQGGAPAPSGA